MSVAEPIVGRVRALRDLVGEDLVDWLDADPEELDRGMEDRGKVQASGQFDLMRFWGVPGPSVWAVIGIAGEVFAEAYEPKGIEE